MKSLISFSEKSCGNSKGGGEMKEIPYRAELKKLYDEKILRISLISFIEKSYMIFKGTVIVFFEDSGKSLIVFSEKS